jgi:hypothetical protein
LSVPNSRPTLKDWCLRELGHPVIEINIDDDQVDDRIDEALQYFQDFHFDGTQKLYVKHLITASDVTNEYIPITDNILGITRMFPVGDSYTSGNMFDLRYQMRLHDFWNFTATSFVNYTITMQHLRTFELLFSGENPIRFNRHMNRLYLDWDWGVDAVAGQYLLIEAYGIVDPDEYTRVYNDRMLKLLLTQLIKRQWGANLLKFTNMTLPGGVQMNGQAIYDTADAEVKRIQEEIRSMYEAPPQWIMA